MFTRRIENEHAPHSVSASTEVVSIDVSSAMASYGTLSIWQVVRLVTNLLTSLCMIVIREGPHYG